jgi:hypothetical protein
MTTKRVIPRAIVIVEGGIVQDVLTDIDIDVEVVDFDVQGLDDYDTKISPSGGGEGYVYSGDVQSKNVKRLDQYWDLIQRARK